MNSYDLGFSRFNEWVESRLDKQHFSCPPYSDEKDRSDYWRGWRDAENKYNERNPSYQF